MMKRLICWVAAALLSGCASSEFTPYEGSQTQWRVGEGAMVDRKYAVPVYYGPPPKPYVVMGMLATGNTRTASGNLASAADKARTLGGDAIIVMHQGTSSRGTYNTATATVVGTGNTATGYASGISVPITATDSSVVVVKWK